MMMVNCTQSCRECKSGFLAPVGHYDTAHATGMTMQRAWARAWVVRGDTTGQEHRTCEWAARAVARSLAFNVCRSGARLSPTALAPHRRRVMMVNYTASKPTEGQVPPAWCAGLVYANKTKQKQKNKWNIKHKKKRSVVVVLLLWWVHVKTKPRQSAFFSGFRWMQTPPNPPVAQSR